ncbi:hypothetical protein LOZ39_003478 [Ophidiomyces ophidiicola]|nr:hypothetical protein LOZ38_006483 [Ophidiomyces ophidiicola]KAI2074312.1 hypothetical protein LOZ37_003768 [Ophidiomyces ophidiicola]KAI2074869.1 hypothetical protein LOZ39_003478 [Ophidiomyces ophidiicola]KAI2088910.1 hypothetical protein LOZ33_006223 [Ophidiomyces ophidiicola]KAI2097440.1 hypothetical protein LOZ35_002221 [Ophidiomyces ophidiicola]
MPQASQSRSKATTKSGSAPTTSESSNSSDQNDEKSMPENLEQRPSPTPGKWDPMAKSLRNCSWEQLQERFIEAMDERSDMENALQKETADLLEVFIAWSQTTVFADEDRAYKRCGIRLFREQILDLMLRVTADLKPGWTMFKRLRIDWRTRSSTMRMW